MRINKLSKAEFSKLFFRPAIYFMTAFLILALVIITFTYTPVTTRTDKEISLGLKTQTVNDIFATFNNISSTDNDAKVNIDKTIENAHEYVVNFANTTSIYNSLLDKYLEINKELTTNTSGTFYSNLFYLANNKNNSETGNAKTNFITSLSNLKTKIGKIKTIFELEIQNDTMDFFLTKNELNQLQTKINSFNSTIPKEAKLNSYSPENLVKLGEIININFQVTDDIKFLKNLKKISVPTEKTTEIIEKYYNTVTFSKTESLLKSKFNEITTFVSTNASSTDIDKKAELNNLFTEYKNIAIINADLLKNSLLIEKASGINDLTLTNYIGFENFNSYSLKEKIVLNQYLLDNKIFDGKYLVNYNMNTLAGNEATAFDFVVFAMQILSVIITVFCMFFVVTSIAGDQNSGVMKMIATRPFTRSEIIGGKILACIKFMLLFVTIAFIASFAVGFAMNGIGTVFNSILIINASFVITMPCYILILLHLLSLCINIVFFILIAGILAVGFRNTTFAVFATFVIYLLGLILNGTASATAWFAFTPFACLDLIKYFGNANIGSVFLGYNMTVAGNIIGYFIALGVLIFALIYFTNLIFKKKDIA